MPKLVFRLGRTWRLLPAGAGRGAAAPLMSRLFPERLRAFRDYQKITEFQSDSIGAASVARASRPRFAETAGHTIENHEAMAARASRSAGRHEEPGQHSFLRRLWTLSGCALLLAGIGQPAAARQGASLVPEALNPAPTIDRDRVDRREPVLPPAPRPAPAPQPPVVDEAAARGVGGVMLARLRYEGSSLPREKLDAALAAHIGQPLTRENLQKIVDTINAVYARNDVAFYSIAVPRQVVTGGELVVRVVEARIGQFALKERRDNPTRLIQAQMDHLMRDRPTHRSQLERTLSLLRDIPGQTVEAQLRTVGKADELALDLDVKSRKVDIALNFNNNGVVNVTSGVQAQVSVTGYGLLREGDATRVSGYLPLTPDRYQFYSASHSTPIGADGMSLSLSGAHVRTRTRDGISGKVTQAGIGLAYPLIRSYKRNLSLSLSLDGINSDNYFLDTAFGAFRTRVVRASGSWSSIGKKGGYAASVTVSRGLDALGARAFAGFSEAQYTKANLQLTAVREVGKAGALKFVSRAQYSRDRLPTTERVSLGGDDAGMAFPVGTVTAERAVAGGVEFSWKVLGAKTAKRGLTAFAYVDGALARSEARPVYNIPARDFSLASAGVGARIAPFGSWTASAQLAFPVKRPFAEHGRKPRFFFSIGRTV